MRENENLTPVDASTSEWRPWSLRAAPVDAVSKPWRIALVAGVIAAHAVAILLLPHWADDEASAPLESALLVSFINRPAERRPLEETAATPASKPASKPAPAADRMTPWPARDPRLRVEPEAPPSVLPQVYTGDGRVRLSEDLMADIDRHHGDQRQFEFQVPGLDKAGKLMQRPPVLVYEATRFDQYYRPNRDLLTDILTRAVEATTKEVSIPIPGSPGHRIVCKVSLLALGGGCGVAGNNDGYTVPGDDPGTLSVEEDRQCRAWWEKIVGASSQDVWRRTRSLYEAQCRKPLERKPTAPRDLPAATGQ